ncbi:hypothetical protein ACNI65_10660 [Roseateles sp. So40a]|uniref:hypothetical protein n=1 Tax=Roseateles sp. So40a TaxID=3400226 RepID=UPI003A86E3FA
MSQPTDRKPDVDADATKPSRRLLDKAPVAPGSVKPDATPVHNDDVQLPHERDQSVGADATGGMGTGAAGEDQRAVMGQAHEDLKQGQVDTDLRATPGLDAQRRDRLVKDATAAPASKRQP